MAQMISQYEDRLRESLKAINVEQRVSFSAACAQQLFPLYELFVSSTGQGDLTTLGQSLDIAWSLDESSAVARRDVEEAQRSAESLVPHDDDDDWTLLRPLAQNAAASVAYALRTWLHDDPQEAVWSARQLYEAADYLVQRGGTFHTYFDGTDVEASIGLAIDGIDAALNGATSIPRLDLRAEMVRLGTRLGELADEAFG